MHSLWTRWNDWGDAGCGREAVEGSFEVCTANENFFSFVGTKNECWVDSKGAQLNLMRLGVGAKIGLSRKVVVKLSKSLFSFDFDRASRESGFVLNVSL